MKQERIKARFVTPKGVAVYPRLQEPDRRYNPMGDYSCKIRLDGAQPAVQAWLDEFREFEESSYKKLCVQHGGKKLRRAESALRQVLDDDDNPTGEWEIKAKMQAKVEHEGRSWEQRPALFDARLKPLPKDGPVVGGGSVVRLSIEAFPFYTSPQVGFGLSIRLKSAQIIELVEWRPSSDPREQGFEEEEGYEAEETVAAPAAAEFAETEEDEEDF